MEEVESNETKTWYYKKSFSSGLSRQTVHTADEYPPPRFDFSPITDTQITWEILQWGHTKPLVWMAY